MKKIFLALSLFLCASVCANEALDTVLRLPEAAALYRRVCQEGRVEVIYAPFNSVSKAMWQPETRRIVLNTNRPCSPGARISSVLFELHNALSDRRFDYTDELARKHKITKSGYVEAIERIEYDNAVKTSKLLEKGIRMGLYPRDARWPIHPSFDVHFSIQQQVGHSQQIAELYDHLMYYS